MKTSALLYNLIGIVLSLLVLKACFQQPGYSFVKKMLSSNYEVIKKHKNLNVEERYAIKLGIGYSAFKYVRENTPDSAVILLPRREDFMPENQKSRFGGEVYKIMWASRFLIPEKSFPDTPWKKVMQPTNRPMSLSSTIAARNSSTTRFPPT